MRKKHTKTKRGVIFVSQKAKIAQQRQQSLVTFLLGSLIIVSILWVLNSLHPRSTPVYHIPTQGISTNTDSGYVPFAARWQKLMETQPTPISKPVDYSGQVIWHGPRDKKEVALTFDADMTPVMVGWLHSGKVATYNDPKSIKYLTEHNIKATFFLTGLWIESYPTVTRELAENPLFELENHTYSHPSMAGYCYGQPQIPRSQYPFEIEKTQQLIEQYTHQTPKYFRFSGGCYDKFGLDLVKKEGLITVHWDDVADDGFNNNEEEIINNVVSEAQNGSIIVMHIGGMTNVPQTVNALPTIITELENKGYTFVTVAELLGSESTAHAAHTNKTLSILKPFQNKLP